ncbi:MAG: VOC family protein [Candidatus Hodarchaeales archaeon]
MNQQNKTSESGKIIGIGGIFFKSTDPGKLTTWYRKHLGFSSQIPYMEGDDTITMKWKSWTGENENTVWAPFPLDTTYISPIEDLMQRLAKSRIEPLGVIVQHPFGKFAQILDPEGNKIEFWEPAREHFKDKY